MINGGMKARPYIRTSLIIYGLLFAIFALFMAWFYNSISIDPPGSYIEEGRARGYGRNSNMAYLWAYFLTGEFFLLLAILAPHKGHRHWAIVLTGFIIAALWTMMLGFGIMHSGPVYGIHLFWMVTVSFILMFALILGFFDRRYDLPSRGNLRIQFYRGLVILFSGILAGILALAIIIGGFTVWAMLI